MALTAKLNFLRMSPRKVRLVADAVRGMDAEEAEVYLERAPRRAAQPVLKLLRSAIANATHNHQKDRGGLFIQTITVDKGPMFKRYRTRAFGRSADIHKHTSHIVLSLGERAIKKPKRFSRPVATVAETGTLEEMTKASGAPKKEPTGGKAGKREKGVAGKQRFMAMGKKFFRRKSV